MRKDKVEGDTLVALFARMEKELSRVALNRAGRMGYREEIGIIRAAIGELNGGIEKWTEEPQGEVIFFRDYWPQFYSRLFYYQLLQGFDAKRRGLPKEGIPALIAREETVVADYFRLHQEFWIDFITGGGNLDHEFTRSYSRNCWADPLSLVIDTERATIASHEAAWCLAYERYLVFLEDAKREPVARVSRGRYEWKETKTAAVQLIKAQAEAGSIFIDGVPATATQLQADWEEKFGVELGDFNNLLYASDATKIDPAPYLTKLIKALMGRRERLGK